MWSDNVTVCLYCRNEEKRIEYAIRNFKDKFRIMVVDDIPPSTDLTKEICKKLGAEYVMINKRGYAEQLVVMNEVWSKVKTEYIITTLCGEYVPDELLRLYAKVANEKTYDVICAWRISITAGKHILAWGDARKYRKGTGHLRFSRRGSIDYKDNIIHREGRIACPKDRVLGPSNDIHLMFYQFRDYDASWSEAHHAKYNDINAMELYKRGEKYSFFKMMYTSIGAFMLSYFIRGSWKQGHLGFMHSYYRFTLYMGVYLRLWDIEHNMRKDNVSDINNTVRAKLLSNEMKIDELFK